jgi:hypothetical protein
MRYLAALIVFAGCASSEVAGPIDGELGVVRFDVAFDAEPPVTGPIVATIWLTDKATDAPIDEAELRVAPFMPAMGHGAEDTVVTSLGDGVYQATWAFTMPGAWAVALEVHEPDDHATVDVDVE